MPAGQTSSTVDLVLLGMVMEQPRSAYDIQKQATQRNISGGVKMSTPSVYKKVLRLQQQGYLAGTAEKEGRVEKVVYSITDRGRARFVMLMSEFAAAPVEVNFDLNAVIAGLDKLPTGVASTLLADIRSTITTQKEYLEDHMPAGDVPLATIAILRQRVYVLAAMELWLDEFIEEFEAP